MILDRVLSQVNGFHTITCLWSNYKSMISHNTLPTQPRISMILPYYPRLTSQISHVDDMGHVNLILSCQISKDFSQTY